MVPVLCAVLAGIMTRQAAAQTSVVNGDFETGDLTGWQAVGSQVPVISTNGHGGIYCADLMVTNVDAGAQKSELDQNTLNAGGGSVNAGEHYNFSFWAKNVSSGVSYVQQYNLEWLDGTGAIVGQLGFAGIPGSTGVWTQVTRTNLAAPAGAVTALVQIFGATGAVGTSGYGEVLIDDVSLTVAAPPVTNRVHSTIAQGNAVSWTSTSGAQDQVQTAANAGGPWSNLGSALAGVSGTASVFDAARHGFYRVQEVTPGSGGNLVQDPGFETAAGNAIGAANWNILANAGAKIMATNSSSPAPIEGTRVLYMESSVPAGGGPAPNSDVRSDFIPVTAGTAYNLSFYAANPVRVGGANPQYDIFYYNTNNNPVGGPVFTSFGSVGGTWTLVTNTITPPAGAAKLTIGWIQAVGAGAGFDWVTLIDQVSLSSGTGSTGQTNVLSAAVQPGVQVSWASTGGVSYQVQAAGDLQSTNTAWSTFGGVVTGNGTTNSVNDPATAARKFYQVLQLP